MANSYKWWICILCVQDYGLPYAGFIRVKARSSKEAISKAQATGPKCRYVEDVLGPFNERPAWANGVK